MLLQDQLDALKLARFGKMPRRVARAQQQALGKLRRSDLAERALLAGSAAPSFSLRDGNGVVFSSQDALCIGPILIVFYMGRWCPYCKLDLSAIEAASSAIRSRGATIIAVSQQNGVESLRTVCANGLSFPSLADRGGRVAHAFGLRWQASAELKAVEGECGTDLAVPSSEARWPLTMPARYIVAMDGTVAYADISIDYTQRGDPTELLPVLDRLQTLRTS